ncbi:MAG TPA: sporulation integral membrane protein YlbJ [Firmicutes bacterium]|nr:sporulation integral membrane protein YlbJ [Bacillota bacterium]
MRKHPAGSRRTSYLMAALGLFVTISIIIYPDEAFHASVEGLRVWWEIVFPALMPFFIAAEVLMGLGVVHFIGALLEPLMRPVFDVPGVGAFAMAMGLASGYPIGARIAARLRRENLCTQVEAERLVAFTNTADPVFMVGAVAVGMFHSPALGVTIAGAHYISSIILGVLMRLHGPNIQERPIFLRPSRRQSYFKKALDDLINARRADGRPFGQLFGDSVRDSVNTLLIIGGFIMMFSVMIKVLTAMGAIRVISLPVSWVLSALGINQAIAPALVSGVFEITIGTELASRAACSLTLRVMAASAIIAWSGLSVLAQVTSMTNGTDIRILPYVIARIAHAFIAAVVALFLMGPAGQVIGNAVVPASVAALTTPRIGMLARLIYSGTYLTTTLGCLLIASAVIQVAKSSRIFGFWITGRPGR